MSVDPTPPIKKGLIEVSYPSPDPVRDARLVAEIRKYHQSAAYQIGRDIRAATPELLARHITEIDTGERQAFLDQLIRQLGQDDLDRVSESLRQRHERGAA